MEIGRKISCDSCQGACCRKGVAIELNSDEEEHLKVGGTRFLPLYKAKQGIDWAKTMEGKTSQTIRGQLLIEQASQLHPDNGLYLFISDCSYLDKENDFKCADHENRAKACMAFEPGSEGCIKARTMKGIF